MLAERERRLRRQREPRARAGSARATTWSCSTTTCSPTRTGCPSSSGGLRRGRHRSRGSAPALPRRADPVRRVLPQRRCAGVVRPPLPLPPARPPGPAQVAADAIAVTGACMYLRRDLIDQIGASTRRYPMGYEDVDYCLRAWEAGRSVRYEPAVRADPPGVAHARDRRRRARADLTARFWDSAGAAGSTTGRCGRPTARCGSSTSRRAPASAAGTATSSSTSTTSGARPRREPVLARAGRRTGSRSRRRCAPSRSTTRWRSPWHDVDAIKIATWWPTAEPVWRASVRRGRPVFFVQDIETSYYAGRDPRTSRRGARCWPATARSSAT